jgi:hypothetical protein
MSARKERVSRLSIVPASRRPCPQGFETRADAPKVKEGGPPLSPLSPLGYPLIFLAFPSHTATVLWK